MVVGDTVCVQQRITNANFADWQVSFKSASFASPILSIPNVTPKSASPLAKAFANYCFTTQFADSKTSLQVVSNLLAPTARRMLQEAAANGKDGEVASQSGEFCVK